MIFNYLPLLYIWLSSNSAVSTTFWTWFIIVIPWPCSSYRPAIASPQVKRVKGFSDSNLLQQSLRIKARKEREGQRSQVNYLKKVMPFLKKKFLSKKRRSRMFFRHASTPIFWLNPLRNLSTWDWPCSELVTNRGSWKPRLLLFNVASYFTNNGWNVKLTFLIHRWSFLAYSSETMDQNWFTLAIFYLCKIWLSIMNEKFDFV